jgi:2-dehydropantoate 2-reductase
MADGNKVGRFVIYGAGGIGSIIGGHLAMEGSHVVLIGRSDHMNSIRNHGLKLITPSGTHTVPMETATSPSELRFGHGDAVLVTMKGQNTQAAMRDLHEAAGDVEVPVFCMQNGVRNEELASNHFARVYGARVNIGAVYMTPGEVVCRREPPGWLVMGIYPKGKDSLVESVASELREAGFYALVTPDVMPYKWGKLMSNLGNATGAITNDNSREARSVTQAAQNEARQLLNEAGIRWLSEAEITKEWPDFGAKPRAAMQTDEQSSTWQSLGRQQGSVETEFLNGEIVRVAKRLGKAAPINETITRICTEMAARKEKPGKYNSAQLSEMLGLK